MLDGWLPWEHVWTDALAGLLGCAGVDAGMGAATSGVWRLSALLGEDVQGSSRAPVNGACAGSTTSVVGAATTASERAFFVSTEIMGASVGASQIPAAALGEIGRGLILPFSGRGQGRYTFSRGWERG